MTPSSDLMIPMEAALAALRLVGRIGREAEQEVMFELWEVLVRVDEGLAGSDV